MGYTSGYGDCLFIKECEIMQFAAALVEYLISGILAAAWALPLFWRLFGIMPPIDDGWVVMYLPAAYVLGIYIDSTASVLLKTLRLQKKTADAGSYDRTTLILAKGSDALAQAMQVYVSRDRIARGVFLNATISCVVLPLTLPAGLWVDALMIAAVMAIWSFFIWKRLDRLSNDFKTHAVAKLHPTGLTSQGRPWIGPRFRHGRANASIAAHCKSSR
jgi:hypothetical protein